MIAIQAARRNQREIPMDAAKLFLTVVGMIYIAFAGWCVAKPAQTSAAVGFQLMPGAGQSEYVTVYGGFQLALAVLFFWPWLDASIIPFSLMTCLIVHACLVLMRTVGFFLYSNIPAMTVGFAISEWVVMLLTIGLWCWRRSQG